MNNLKCYIINYLIPSSAGGGIAVVIAESQQSAEQILKTNGNLNGGNNYIIETIQLINDTNIFTTSCILAEYNKI